MEIIRYVTRQADHHENAGRIVCLPSNIHTKYNEKKYRVSKKLYQKMHRLKPSRNSEEESLKLFLSLTNSTICQGSLSPHPVYEYACMIQTGIDVIMLISRTPTESIDYSDLEFIHEFGVWIDWNTKHIEEHLPLCCIMDQPKRTGS